VATASACASTGIGIPRPGGPDRVPTAPAINHPSFTYRGPHGYYLIGNALTPGQNTLTLTVSPVEGEPGATP
jgi:hypothetical protein